MTPAHKTRTIVLAAALIAAGAILLAPSAPKAPKLPSAAMDTSGLWLRTHLSSTHVTSGSGETYLVITLEAPSPDELQQRPPVNLAIVLDRSGSMSGSKLMHAKQAARELIDQLRPPDRFAILSYGSDVTVESPSVAATDAAKSTAFAALDRIYDDGGTNLSSGLTQATQQLLGVADSGHVNRIVLISDGQANEGIVAPDDLATLAAQTARRGVSVTTVGVGLDFDERTMTRLAVSGRGNYYFAESSGSLANLFARELERLSATVATGINLTVAPAAGVDVIEGYGYALKTFGDQTVISVADLHAGEARKVALRLRVRSDHRGEVDLAAIGLSFQPAGSDVARDLAVMVQATVTADPALVIAHRDAQAIQYVERARTAQVIDKATAVYEAGQADGAILLLQKRQQEAEEIAAELGDADMDREINTIIHSIQKDFAAAQTTPDSPRGKRARKRSRKDAYDLRYGTSTSKR